MTILRASIAAPAPSNIDNSGATAENAGIMTIGDPRYGSGDPSSYSRVRPSPADLPGGTAGAQRRAAAGGRRMAQLDAGTVALALSGMTFYWLMPALMSRRRPRRTRRSRGPAQ